MVTAWEWKRYLPFLFLCAVFAVCIVNLYLALGHSARAWAAGTALCGGFASGHAGLLSHRVAVRRPNGIFSF